MIALPAISGRGAKSDRAIVVAAETLDLPIGQPFQALRKIPGDVLIGARERAKALAVPFAGGEEAKLLGIVQKLVARGVRQGLSRQIGAIVAAPELVGAREMIQRAASLAFRQPQEAQGAMRVIMFGLQRANPAQSVDRAAASPEG